MGNRLQVLVVVLVTAIVGSTLRLGTLAPVVVGVLLLAANVMAMRWSIGRRLQPTGGLRSLAGALTAVWLAVSILPGHNFTNRRNEDAVASVGIEAFVELLVFFGAGLVAVAVIRSLEPTLERSRPPTVLFLLPVWVIASSTWSQTGPYAFARGLQMITLPFLAWATIALGRADRAAATQVIEGYLRWFVRITAVLVALGVAFGPIYVPASAQNLLRFTWIGAHPNGAGLILSVAIVIIVATPGRVLRLPWQAQGALTAVFAWAMHANHSRTAWLCLAVGVAVAFALKGHLVRMVRWVGTPMIGAGLVVAIYFWGDRIGDYLLRDSGSDDLANGNGRLQLWGIGFRNLDTPFDWLGGLGYGAARQIFVAELAWARTAHNSVLSLLVSVGLIGVAFLGVTVVQAARNVVAGRIWKASPSGVAVAALLVLVLVNGLATDILAEPNIGFAVLNLVAAVAFVPRLDAGSHGASRAPDRYAGPAGGRPPARRLRGRATAA